MNLRTAAQRRFAAEQATIAVVALLWLTCLVLGVGGPRATQAISNFGLIAAAASAGLACLATARRSSAQHRRMWKLLGVSALSWGSGQAAWTWYESVLGREVPFPSLADVGYLAAVPLAAAGLLSLPFAARSMAGRLRLVLDGLMIAASLLLTSWIFVLNPLPGWHRQPRSHRSVSPIRSATSSRHHAVLRPCRGPGGGTDILCPYGCRPDGHGGGRQRLRVPHGQRVLQLRGADRHRLVPRLRPDPPGRAKAERPVAKEPSDDEQG